MALPDRPDPAQLRRRARELQRAARAGEPEAVARVKAQGFDPGTVGLRRAQHTLARELGHASWPALLTAAEAAAAPDAEPRSPWDRAAPAPRPPLLEPAVAAAAEMASALGSRSLAGEHLVLAATDPDLAGHVELAGLDRDWLVAWVARLFTVGRSVEGRALSTNPLFEENLALAAGLCVAGGLPLVTPAALAVAGLYSGYGSPVWVDSGGLDPDEVADALAVHHRLSVYPAHLEPPRPPRGDLVYYPSGSPGVTQELSRRYPPGRGGHWGVNTSTWKPGFHWVWGDDDIPMLDLVRSVLADPSQAVAVPWREAHRRESEARRQAGSIGSAIEGDPIPRPSRPVPVGSADTAPGSLAAYRTAGRDLLAEIWDRDPTAESRVLASHPIYAGRDPGRLDLAMLRLADAYATVAAEAGYGSWPELVAAADGVELGTPRRRWAGSHSAQAFSRAMGMAGRRRDPGLRPAHIVLALLHAAPSAGAAAAGSIAGAPAEPAAATLASLGVTIESVTQRLGPDGAPGDPTGVRSTPTWHALMGWAAGLALGRGADGVGPPDVLAALAYGLPPGDLAAEAGVDADDVHAGLAGLGHAVPPAPPSAVWSPVTG